ncbi:hypothetical protein HMN09_00998300 [Mycena chlorophos]|uniref:Uncharacterized protein n=1 Tax=Mycena chlorophos TaxID=658473 RepID=A0A8H6SKD1_MYCCL|nr:hypothetical protein HMN09_00998300 [Mycena chlorophos]
MTAEYESAVIALCAAHKKENRHHGDYRACIYTESHFVKYGPRKQLEPELKTHSYIANYALTSPNAPRIAGISAFADGNTMYLVMERIRLVAPPPSDLPDRICKAVIWLLRVPAPQGHSLGPLGDGRIPHKFFKDFKAPLEFPDTAQLDAYSRRPSSETGPPTETPVVWADTYPKWDKNLREYRPPINIMLHAM